MAVLNKRNERRIEGENGTCDTSGGGDAYGGKAGAMERTLEGELPNGRVRGVESRSRRRRRKNNSVATTDSGKITMTSSEVKGISIVAEDLDRENKLLRDAGPLGTIDEGKQEGRRKRRQDGRRRGIKKKGDRAVQGKNNEKNRKHSNRIADKKSPKRNAHPSFQNKQTSKHRPGTEQKGNENNTCLRRRNKAGRVSSKTQRGQAHGLPNVKKKKEQINAGKVNVISRTGDPDLYSENFPQLCGKNPMDAVNLDKKIMGWSDAIRCISSQEVLDVQNIDAFDVSNISNGDLESFTRFEMLGNASYREISRYGELEKGNESKDERHNYCNINTSTRKKCNPLDIHQLRREWSQAIEEKKNMKIQQERLFMEKLELAENRRSEKITQINDDGASECSFTLTTKLSCEKMKSSDKLSDTDPDLESRVDTYLNATYPVHYAIWKNDERMVQKLIYMPLSSSKRDAKVSLVQLGLEESLSNFFKDDKSLHSIQCKDILETKFSILHLAAQLYHPNLVKLLLEHCDFAIEDLDECYLTALTYSLDGVIKIFLSYESYILSKQKISGDSPLHICCRYGEANTVRMILCFVLKIGEKERNNNSYGKVLKKSCVQQNLVCAQNYAGQTPLHLAYLLNRPHAVETLLSLISNPCAAKVLNFEDKEGNTPLLSAIQVRATEIVMHLLMWRGNRRNSQFLSIFSKSIDTSLKCPLTLAVTSGAIDMVNLLLEFGDPSASAATFRYDYNGAICKAVFSLDNESLESHNVIKILTEAGANPYAKLEISYIINTKNYRFEGWNLLSIAACRGQVVFVELMMNIHSNTQINLRHERRQNPLLGKQPDSFFSTLEGKENEANEISIQEALVRTLLLATEGKKNGSKNNIISAMSQFLAVEAIFKQGTKLNDWGWEYLLSTLWKNKKHRCHSLPLIWPQKNFKFEASYRQICFVEEKDPINITYNDRSSANSLSVALSHLSWIWNSDLIASGDIYCSWLNKQLRSNTLCVSPHIQYMRNDECFLVVQGQRLLAHKSILSSKSDKLRAAIHFVSMSTKAGSKVEIQLDISLDLVKMFVTHCYHGSIVFGLSQNIYRCCEQLLNLSVIAQMYLCPSLLLECEMRLHSKVTV